MGLFHKRRQPAQWEDAYTAAPKFYRQPDGTPFGAIALTENTKTILPKNPQAEYAVDGQPVSQWQLLLVSTTKDGILGNCDYFEALARLKSQALDTNAQSILVRGLSLEELEALR